MSDAVHDVIGVLILLAACAAGFFLLSFTDGEGVAPVPLPTPVTTGP